MAKIKTLQPQYVPKFQCIGGSCEDNCCCSTWNIFIDKSTYKLYKNCPNASLRRNLDKNILRNRVNATVSEYAKIKMDDNSGCPFLDKEKFCSLQRTMGEKYLSITCMVYPRHYNMAGGILEKSLCLSCPEVARLALLNTNLMEFEMVEEESYLTNYVDNILDMEDAKKKHSPVQYFSELRIFTITLLQNRLYPVWKRLAILGLFCSNLSNLISERKIDETLPLITTYLEYLKTGAFHDSLEKIHNELNIQIMIIKELTANRAAGAKGDHFAEYFAEAMAGINYSAELTKEELADNYASIYKNYYQPIVSKHEYILENYLVNYAFANLFPFGGEKNIFDNYIIFIVHYAMIKTLLIGMAGYHKENFDICHIIKLIQSLSKVATHSPMYLKSVVDCLKSNNMDNMSYMAILIKN